MLTLIAIGLVGGLITGISPCILPVLPVILISGAQSARAAAGTSAAAGTVDLPPAKPSRAESLRPYLVIAGLVVSFSTVTLAGSALLSLLHLPQDAIRWLALVALVAIGVGLIFPSIEALLEKPFSRRDGLDPEHARPASTDCLGGLQHYHIIVHYFQSTIRSHRLIHDRSADQLRSRSVNSPGFRS